ncbi:MFS general substrate transporter [Choiromyces venosus 120613-1]|uniref:MFS general substrate transporter n=1 Tax=Choiromyces venosus 120613-1 TaxID=1336337 RepID=A0A3N4JKF8_9PEZI|nr:MFS general substrate transporter [Choiromyces venosus 120613-1]
MSQPRTPPGQPEINSYASPEAFESEKSTILDDSLALSHVKRLPRSPSSESNYLEWNTPPEALYADPEQLPSSVTCYTDPFTWSRGQKNAIMVLACFSTGMSAYAAGAYTSGIDQMMEEWNVSRLALLVGVTAFTTGFAVAPLVLAPLSEVYGRRYVYLITFGLFNVCHLSSALCHSYPGMLVARFFLGVGGSTFGTVVGGIISDIFHAPDRGFPMAFFSMFGLSFTGVGPLASGVIAENLSWRWIHWIQLILNVVLMAIAFIVLKETRGSVLLSDKANALNKFLDEMGVQGSRWKVKADEERESFALMVKVSLTRPFRLLITESVVFWFSCWVSFAWGVLYLFLQGVPLVFVENHGFTVAQVGYVFTGMFAGGVLALCCNAVIEIGTKKYFSSPTPNPEARLYSACTIGCLLPIGMFWFGWTSFPSQHWILPTMAVGCATMGIYSVYLAVFNYLADTYHRYASSALAAQSFCRNFLAGGFPLITNMMYHRMGFAGASSFLGGIGALLAIVPWVLVFYGTKIRARSQFAKEIMNT